MRVYVCVCLKKSLSYAFFINIYVEGLKLMELAACRQ